MNLPTFSSVSDLAVKSAAFTILFTLLSIHQVSSQKPSFENEPSAQNPFGLPHPEAPEEIKDFAPLIGESICSSVTRNPDQTWGDTLQMLWRWKYIMNGMGVQDETLNKNGRHAGSIRQYIPDSSAWYVHFYSSNFPTPTLPAWEGSKNENGDIILYREQQAPNGMEGFYKINFTDITPDSFEWLGEWVNPDETIRYPTWKISCTKLESE